MKGDRLTKKATKALEEAGGRVWYDDSDIPIHVAWDGGAGKGDNEDHLESLSCPVLIGADDLRNLLQQARSNAIKALRDAGWLSPEDLVSKGYYFAVPFCPPAKCVGK